MFSNGTIPRNSQAYNKPDPEYEEPSSSQLANDKEEGEALREEMEVDKRRLESLEQKNEAEDSDFYPSSQASSSSYGSDDGNSNDDDEDDEEDETEAGSEADDN
ncbi:hypothetical protein Hypma_015598 [Hypsizygus marmoreus]|uniref:Uncharacterized protein n=1 Tax=Hypsizygus marmoreus TaxID=39966 RepID=A0A369K3P9_HYPMA|nr:hypothetical protein Hypma_015598 [Hypsizygus marmoreus]